MTTRRLAAILAADVVGFSKLMGQDEEGTLARIRALRRDVIEPKVQEHHGQIVKTTGDGFLVEFASPVEAVRCAVGMQAALASAHAAPQEPSQPIQMRIGINLGDILIEPDGDIYGDGVNVAARLEQLAEPGGVCISGAVDEVVRDRLGIVAFEDRGEQQVKNIARPVRVYTLAPPGAARSEASKSLPLPDKPSVAVLPFTNMSGDPEQEYLADGIVEEIITALSRFGGLFVIARNSSFTYKGRAVDVRQVGRELGVEYVLEGSLRRAGNRIRITGQLIEAHTGRHVWAERYDRELSDSSCFRTKRSRIAQGQGGYWLSASAVSARPYGRRRPGELERGLTYAPNQAENAVSRLAPCTLVRSGGASSQSRAGKGRPPAGWRRFAERPRRPKLSYQEHDGEGPRGAHERLGS